MNKAARPQPTQTCPDFDLAPLVGFAPEVFSRTGHEEADAHVLAFALAFNDMKGIQWTIVQLDKCRPKEMSVTPESGQWNGMRLHVSRLTLLVLHELLNAIRSASESHVFADEEFAEALRRVDGRYRADWDELVSLASAKPGDSPVRKYLERVRHNFTAHYYQPKSLLSGYRAVFFDAPRNEFNKSAFASFGSRIEATRFYFADAAVQMGQKLLDPSDALIGEVHTYVLTMFQALRFVIEAYLGVKQERVNTPTTSKAQED